MWRIVMAGLVGGLMMAGFLRVIESVSGLKVYTLLLNVDYIPFFKRATGVEWLELSMHMVVSIGVSWFIVVGLFRVVNTATVWKAYVSVILFSLLIGILLYPSTVLSERTPALGDPAAWFWWLASHVLYGIVMSALLQPFMSPTKSHTQSETER